MGEDRRSGCTFQRDVYQRNLGAPEIGLLIPFRAVFWKAQLQHECQVVSSWCLGTVLCMCEPRVEALYPDTTTR